MRRILFLLGGPLAAMLVYLWLQHAGEVPAAMAAVILWMAIWWISEAVPIPVTSLLPLVLFPLLGITDLSTAAAFYGKDVIFLFVGGFLLALGIERSGLHERVALHIVRRIGSSPSRLVLGTLVATGLLSMWINSTAAVLVMLPIGMSLVGAAPGHARLGAALALAVSYGATIGGMATPVGTPPNLVFMEQWKQFFPDRDPVGFGQWMLFGVPYAALYLFLTWLVMTKVLFRTVRGTGISEGMDERSKLDEQLAALGPIRRDEVFSAVVFGMIALLWMTGDDIVFNDGGAFRGWRSLTGMKAMGDPAVAMFGGIVLFLIPSRAGDRALLDWEFAQARIPWGVVLLIGSGFAIAGGTDLSGLDTLIGQALTGLDTGSSTGQVAAVATGVTLLSELGSNTAVTSLVLSILARAAASWHMAAEAVMIPATLAASCGFMLPIASPMQAIVFASGNLSMKQMVKAGVWMDAIGIALLALLWPLLGAAVFG